VGVFCNINSQGKACFSSSEWKVWSSEYGRYFILKARGNDYVPREFLQQVVADFCDPDMPRKIDAYSTDHGEKNEGELRSA